MIDKVSSSSTAFTTMKQVNNSPIRATLMARESSLKSQASESSCWGSLTAFISNIFRAIWDFISCKWLQTGNTTKCKSTEETEQNEEHKIHTEIQELLEELNDAIQIAPPEATEESTSPVMSHKEKRKEKHHNPIENKHAAFKHFNTHLREVLEELDIKTSHPAVTKINQLATKIHGLSEQELNQLFDSIETVSEKLKKRIILETTQEQTKVHLKKFEALLDELLEK